MLKNWKSRQIYCIFCVFKKLLERHQRSKNIKLKYKFSFDSLFNDANIFYYKKKYINSKRGYITNLYMLQKKLQSSRPIYYERINNFRAPSLWNSFRQVFFFLLNKKIIWKTLKTPGWPIVCYIDFSFGGFCGIWPG